MQKPVLNKRMFWDVDFEQIDFNNRHRFVIERVFERGDVEDIRELRRFYGMKWLRRRLAMQNGWGTIYSYSVKIFLIYQKNISGAIPQDHRAKYPGSFKWINANSRIGFLCFSWWNCACIAVGHRRSVDLDLFSIRAIDFKEIAALLAGRFSEFEIFSQSDFGLFSYINQVKVDMVE